MKSKFVLFAFCLALLSGCGKKGFNMGGTPECAVETLQPTTVNLKSSYPATIKGKQDIEIRPQVSGFITKLNIDEGSMVKKGQVLFVIDPVQYESAARAAKAAVATAKANVSTQEITVKNKRELNKKNIISDYDLEMAENTLASAKAQLASAEAQLISANQNLAYTRVTSPSDGVAGTIPYRVGSLVSASSPSPLTVISDITQMYVYFSLTEKELLNLIRQDGSQTEFLNSFHHTCYQRYGSLSLRYAGKIIDVYDNFLVISFTCDTDNTAVVRVSCTDGIHVNTACDYATAIMICMVSDDLCSSRCCKKFCYIMMVNFCEMISYSLKTCC